MYTIAMTSHPGNAIKWLKTANWVDLLVSPGCSPDHTTSPRYQPFNLVLLLSQREALTALSPAQPFQGSPPANIHFPLSAFPRTAVQVHTKLTRPFPCCYAQQLSLFCWYFWSPDFTTCTYFLLTFTAPHEHLDHVKRIPLPWYSYPFAP